jgi:hypothetical protein
VQHKLPGHWNLLLDRQIHEMGHTFVYVGHLALSFYGDFVAAVRLDRLLLYIHPSFVAPVSQAQFLKGKESVIKLIFEDDWRVEGNGHS